MNRLAKSLIDRIALTGPITLAEYMSECLLHPEHGYYTRAEVFGAKGDFTTAPEVSQMFGELIGLALAQAWMDQGAPARAILAEAGPGRGTLMADMLRVAQKVPGLAEALDVRLIEASPRLRDLQHMALGDRKAGWIDRIDDLPEAPLFFVANEFLDALPIRQFQREGSGWRERMVTTDGKTLGPALSAPRDVPDLSHRLADTKDGDIVEVCPSLPAAVSTVSERIVRFGGLALLIDYGDWRSLGDTFQALRKHAPVDPFEAPGEADLTAHVDFETIARAATAAGAQASPMVQQGLFLERLGITRRAQDLARSIPDPAALENHVAAHRRLTHPQEMGSLFKTVAIYPRSGPTPPGFET